ncbi:HTH domain protein [Anaerohalosphaera lusitana]|uniref:HTH domain protein n=1 Tax=Anaerohalosphaera lusitana TaxID=1936003 RepID=A0A1U9NHB9_9BACT|nr:WYL domain-containing protein [Anaerohalosphaera lusitana]AQT67309.1 HTH domain protein [Anaerohalosphaera lusitana]
MKLARITRIVQILTYLQSGQKYSVDQLADLMGVSRRTIFRDLNQLEAIGIPFRFDSEVHGYTLDPEFFLPSIDLNLQEALSLLMLVQKGRSHLPLPFKNSALLAGIKIENNLPAEIKSYCNSSLENISIRPHNHAPMDQLDSVFAAIQRAIKAKRKLKMAYFSLYDGGDIELEFSPYHIFYNHRAWYVVGYSSIHDETRTFKLNRIKQLSVLKKRFIDGDKFDIAEYFGRAWSMIREGKVYNVTLRFSPRVARNVSEVRWHVTQQHSFNEDGSLTANFRVDGLNEIKWWILGYGDQVEVIKPAKLRKEVARAGAKIAKLNSDPKS